MEQVTRAITVKGDPGRIYDIWAEIESFPLFIPDLKSVARTGERSSRWVASAPFGREVSWEAETTTAEPGRRLAWNTVAGEAKTSGQVVFAEIGDGQTSVTVTLNWTPPGGATSEALAKALRDPGEVLERGLRAFKAHAEGLVALTT
jgi:uncharacterized membrane protein